MMARKQISLFEDERMTLQSSIDMTVMSMLAHATEHRHWSVSFSGGGQSRGIVVPGGQWIPPREGAQA